MRSQFRSEDIARDGKPEPCTECKKFHYCKKLCPRVEAWVNQDYVGRKNKEIMLQTEPDMDHYTNEFVDYMNYNFAADVVPDFETAENAWKAVSAMRLPRSSFEFAKYYYRDGKTLTETAAALKISSQAALDRHKKLKRDIKNRLERIEIWRKIKEKYKSGMDKYALAEALYFGAFYSNEDIYRATGVSRPTITRRVRVIYRENKLDKFTISKG